MAISLYDVSVAGFQQSLQGVSKFLEKGFEHFRAGGVDLDEVVESRIYKDMFPFRFQIVSVVHHSLGAIEGAKRGVFSPPTDQRPHNYEALQQLVEEARTSLQAVSREDIDALEGRDVVFDFRDVKIPFTAENFLMSFSTPNLHFHAATAYGILRSRGVPLGKRDFMGPLRIKR
jgi:uncharacterized protein